MDLLCAEVAVAYEQFVHKNPGVKTDHGLSQEQLMEQIRRVKNEQAQEKNEKSQSVSHRPA